MRVAPEDPQLRWHRRPLEGRLAVYGEAGDGPPLLFLHGWGITGRVYARVLPILAATGARVIAPALPGFGRSEELSGELTWESSPTGWRTCSSTSSAMSPPPSSGTPSAVGWRR